MFASTAYMYACMAPKYATGPLSPMTIGARNCAVALYIQYMHPVRASSEYTVPSRLPTKTLPPKIVGCVEASVAPGNPKAHFSLSFGIP